MNDIQSKRIALALQATSIAASGALKMAQEQEAPANVVADLTAANEYIASARKHMDALSQPSAEPELTKAQQQEREHLLKINSQLPLQAINPVIGTNSGHGHAWERPDNTRARCGGAPMCSECAKDAAIVEAAKQGKREP